MIALVLKIHFFYFAQIRTQNEAGRRKMSEDAVIQTFYHHGARCLCNFVIHYSRLEQDICVENPSNELLQSLSCGATYSSELREERSEHEKPKYNTFIETLGHM